MRDPVIRIDRKVAPGRQKNAWIVYLALSLLAIAFLFPFFWMINTSIKPVEETIRIPPVYIPSRIVWQNYPAAWAYQSETLGFVPYLLYFRNTLLICALNVVGAVLSNSLVAYAFARMKWKWRDLAFSVTLATMMVPFPVLMVPTFALFQKLGWIGTFRPLWIPAWFGGAFNIFLLRQFFRTIPFELSEAAKIDGATEFETFRLVILPLSKSALSVVALFTLMYTWNDFLAPLIYLNNQRHFTLGLGLQFFQSQQGGTEWNLMMAAATIVVLPVIAIFLLTQKQFMEGIAVTGLKG
ncbi:MAG: carbohydrate ABC transporter permease [Chthonomonadales bacterium]